MIRETREEAGIDITPAGIYRIEHTPTPSGVRVRVIYLAYPRDDTPPKSDPDDESLEAGWFTMEQIRSLPLRGREVLALFEAVSAGAPVYPMSLIQPEGEPLKP